MTPDEEALLESQWTEIQKPHSRTSSRQKHEHVIRYRRWLAFLIAFGILLTLILLLGASYFMHVYSNENPQKDFPDSANPICLLPIQTGSDCQVHTQHWGWDSRTHSCKQFIYGECNSNKNNFLTKEKCEEVCKIRINV
ncbi:unnamed protein product [Trichobilharzia regenti]|uniref:BPTI/Kunitz inhibitor domain-containing protein n=1 Tax=Trichobilharzia regenti TaxID=157069 RepID=A0A183WG25_TRIRE|nr:unnamed protein product [Trichobilharzia regenti]VDQ06958.1 unnamed protein product [Trichobilharzia regenti]